MGDSSSTGFDPEVMMRQFCNEFGRDRESFISLQVEAQREVMLYPLQGTFALLMFRQQVAPMAKLLFRADGSSCPPRRCRE
ncbi:MAG: hypothetical protein K0Q55_751 [Verrucomicrobia bacterium]|nr:hypothetical protein [Verrucomicrobiota bacterium]